MSLTNNKYSIHSTTDFADRLKTRTLGQNEVLASYYVSNLFTEVLPARENLRLLLKNKSTLNINYPLCHLSYYSLGPVVANIFMSKLKTAFKTRVY